MKIKVTTFQRGVGPAGEREIDKSEIKSITPRMNKDKNGNHHPGSTITLTDDSSILVTQSPDELLKQSPLLEAYTVARPRDTVKLVEPAAPKAPQPPQPKPLSPAIPKLSQ
jgi:hypothetical protein